MNSDLAQPQLCSEHIASSPYIRYIAFRRREGSYRAGKCKHSKDKAQRRANRRRAPDFNACCSGTISAVSCPKICSSCPKAQILLWTPSFHYFLSGTLTVCWVSVSKWTLICPFDCPALRHPLTVLNPPDHGISAPSQNVSLPSAFALNLWRRCSLEVFLKPVAITTSTDLVQKA